MRVAFVNLSYYRFEWPICQCLSFKSVHKQVCIVWCCCCAHCSATYLEIVVSIETKAHRVLWYVILISTEEFHQF